MTHYKVKLLTFPSINTGMIGLAATFNRGDRSLTSAASSKFGTLDELRRACEKANVPVLASRLPSPTFEYDLTRDQLGVLGFHLQVS